MNYYNNMKYKLENIKKKEEIVILALETSCDETSAAVVKNGRQILSNMISSQIDLHKEYGGVVPEIASRKHVEIINPLIDEALSKAGIGFSNLDAIGVTYGPGLVGALLVGVSTAKALAYGLSLPLVGVHHIEGHINANYITHKDLKPPYICLVVSGGHSHIVMVNDYGEYSLLGRTRDDAAGEAYDKVARILGLGYPGGPVLDALSSKGNPDAILFPRVKFKDGTRDFSFSGLKTAVINYLHNLEQKNEKWIVEDVAASFQQAVVDVLVGRTIETAKEMGIKKVAIAGGVAANSALRKGMKSKCMDNGMKLYYPEPVLCTDNGAMIGCAAYYNLLKGKIHDLTLNAVPNMEIGSKAK